MRIALVGTRGIPARYGGFETAVEEVGSRLVNSGHEVRVYCRGADRSKRFLGMDRVRLPAVKISFFETLSHTLLSVLHLMWRPVDVVLVFNAANSPLLPLLRIRGMPIATHVDGLEWQRAKWGPVGRRYYLLCERLAVKLSDEIIADAVGIQDYYQRKYSVSSRYIAYGAPVYHMPDEVQLSDLKLKPQSFHLVVARMEPENNIDKIVDAYISSSARQPLVVVGSVPYRSKFAQAVESLAASDDRVRLVGSVWNQHLLNSLYAGSTTYLHGHSVGGTNPSLLRAMGAGANVVALDVVFNREVLGTTGEFFTSKESLAKHIEDAEVDLNRASDRGRRARNRAVSMFSWDDCAVRYEQLCEDLMEANVERHRP